MSEKELIELFDLIKYILPMVLGPIVAKYVNKNTKPWREWSGWYGRILGLLVSLSDIFRAPSEVAKDVKGEK